MHIQLSTILSGHDAPRWLRWVWSGARPDDTATQRRKLMMSNASAGLMMLVIALYNLAYFLIGNPALIRSGLAQLPFALAAPLIWWLQSRREPTLARWVLFGLAMGGCAAAIVGGQGTAAHAHIYFLLFAVMAVCFFPTAQWQSAALLAALNLSAFVAMKVHGWPADPNMSLLSPVTLLSLQLTMQAGCVLVVVLVVLLSENVAANSESQLRALAMTDLLTALPNRRAFNLALVAEAARGRRHEQPMSLAVLDLDHFKRINDSFGHPIGDQALRHVASVLMTHARKEDTVARIGGEEFAVLMPATDAAQAARVVERLRRAVAANVLATDVGVHTVTTSVGVATLAPGMDSDLALRAADQALYEAKRQGRNRVVAAAA